MQEKIQGGNPLELEQKTRNELVVELDKINSFIAELSNQKDKSEDAAEITVLDKIISGQKKRYETLREQARQAQEITDNKSQVNPDDKYRVWTDEYAGGGGLGKQDDRFVA